MDIINIHMKNVCIKFDQTPTAGNPFWVDRNWKTCDVRKLYLNVYLNFLINLQRMNLITVTFFNAQKPFNHVIFNRNKRSSDRFNSKIILLSLLTALKQETVLEYWRIFGDSQK